jgi:Protein of unknown function (DUF1559)
MPMPCFDKMHRGGGAPVSEQPRARSRVALTAFAFAVLSIGVAITAMATCWVWLLLPYGVCAAAGLVCGVYGFRKAPPLALGAIALLVGGFVGAMLVSGVARTREAANRMVSSDHLRGLALGMHAYYEKFGRFPPLAITDAAGKPLLSWRVTVLPFIGLHDLHERFRLNEPWDSEHNRALLAEMPPIFAAPYRSDAAPGMTVYQVFVGPGTLFDPARPVQLPPTDFPGGPRELLLIVEAAEPVPWTQPADLAYAPAGELPRLGSRYDYMLPPVLFVPMPCRGMQARDASGQMHSVNLDTIDAATLRHFIALDEGSE